MYARGHEIHELVRNSNMYHTVKMYLFFFFWGFLIIYLHELKCKENLLYIYFLFFFLFPFFLIALWYPFYI